MTDTRITAYDLAQELWSRQCARTRDELGEPDAPRAAWTDISPTVRESWQNLAADAIELLGATP